VVVEVEQQIKQVLQVVLVAEVVLKLVELELHKLVEQEQVVKAMQVELLNIIQATHQEVLEAVVVLVDWVVMVILQRQKAEQAVLELLVQFLAHL
jgi:hypothetical protein